jgi:hypothetical protein
MDMNHGNWIYDLIERPLTSKVWGVKQAEKESTRRIQVHASSDWVLDLSIHEVKEVIVTKTNMGCPKISNIKRSRIDKTLFMSTQMMPYIVHFHLVTYVYLSFLTPGVNPGLRVSQPSQVSQDIIAGVA